MESEEFVSPVLATAAIAVVFLPLVGMLLIGLAGADRLRYLLEDHTQKLMLAVAVTATASSLYYSEVVGFIPCEFCWFQRIAMYPLGILLTVALVTRSRLDSKYIVTLAAIGLGLSIYHYQLQLFPEQAGTCSGFVSCTDKNVNQFGFVTIPFMAGCGFVTILFLQVAEWRAAYLARQCSGEDAPLGPAEAS
jgi:disulfide bond formation protein DsbB